MKTFKFETKVDKFEKLNDRFTLATINVCHKGKNRNMSDFSDNAMKTIEDSILCAPVVCEYLKEDECVGGHGGRVVVENNDVRFEPTTFDIGFVDPRTKPHYKQFVERDGKTVNDYLCVDVVLWTGKNDFLKTELEKGLEQSFEIEVNTGHYEESDGYFKIDDATVLQLCLLGEKTEACFHSKVKVFSADERKVMYQQMLNEFKQFSFEGGDEEMDETVVETVVEVEELQAEDVEATEVESKSDDENVEEVEIETEQVEVVDYEAKFNELQVEYGKTISKLDEMTQEFERLQKFEQDILMEKRTASENELFKKFSELENEKEFINLKENANKYSLEEIENICYALVGRKSFSLNKKENIQSTQKLKIDVNQNKTEPIPYGGILA